MADLNRVLMFALSDSLGMQLQYDPSNGYVEGKQERYVNMHGLRLTVPMTIVSSQLNVGCYMLMARVFGNLGLFVVSKRVSNRDILELHVLNLAKMDKLDCWLEKNNPQSDAEALRVLRPAIAKSYIKTKPNGWEAP